MVVPQEPESIEETGLAETTLEHLILKILYFRGDIYGQDLSAAIGLKFSVIQDLVESLKFRHHVQVKKSLGMGNIGALLALTEAGRARARESLEANQYAGPAPVPLAQYCDLVRRQRPREGWVTKESLAKAFRGMVVTERVISQVGPAVSSANSLLLHGKPGDGRTFLIESLNNLESAPIFLPYALECQGNIVQVYDPIYHQRIEEEAPSVLAVSLERSYDRRWAKCKRPFLITGGELTIDMLDLRYNATSKVYEAPFQLKANNGIYLIDDFGRQRATPAEVLNRWIVPMERRVDYLSFLTGGKMTVPFETFLVFSTNLNPADLGDEAFLRRIQYKMLLRGPTESEFIRIFESFCAVRRLPCPRDLISGFVEKHYHRTGRKFRRCHPRDVLTHALNLIQFEKLPLTLTGEVLDRAFESCFLDEHEDETPQEAQLMPMVVSSCSDYWSDRAAAIPTAFGTLAWLASFRATGEYLDPESARLYGETETGRVLERLHSRAFNDWLDLSAEQQARDIAHYLAAPDSRLNLLQPSLAESLAPLGCDEEDKLLFAHDFSTMLEAAVPKPQPEALPGEPPVERPEPIERIA